MTNLKIPIKDTALIRMFLQPFNWEFVELEKTKLGKAKELLT